MEAGKPQWVRIHPLRRAHHALGQRACDTRHGDERWRIYNASPFFPFRIPSELTLGGWLAGALQWHFAAMWLLVLKRHRLRNLRHRLRPLQEEAAADHAARDIPRRAGSARGRLAHEDLSVYNAAQARSHLRDHPVPHRAGVSGLAIWKPVQLQEITRSSRL